MINIAHALKSERIMKALTGMTPSEFSDILPAFEKVLRQEIIGKDRERAPGAGAEHTLETPEDKLVYALFYVSCYPTCDMAAFFSGGVSPPQTCRRAHTFLPAPEKAPEKSLFFRLGKSEVRKNFSGFSPLSGKCSQTARSARCAAVLIMRGRELIIPEKRSVTPGKTLL